VPGASDHLSRLWAAASADAMARAGRTAAATELAVRYRLVTPLTGAVVLERRSDYEAHGLDPKKRSALPDRGVPEPGVLGLVTVGMAVLLGRASASARRRRRDL
jgi:hypothetical protein